MSTELTQLKQEVAELWARYRQQQPQPLYGEDEERRTLAELNRSLEGKRRALSDRSSALRLELENHRRRSARLSPVARVVGGFLGTVMGAVGISAVMPEVASFSLSFSSGHGVVAIAGALLVLGFCVARAER